MKLSSQWTAHSTVSLRYSPSTRVINYSNRTALPRSDWRRRPTLDGRAAPHGERALVSFHHCSFSARRRPQRPQTTPYRRLLYIDPSTTTVLCRAPAGRPAPPVLYLSCKSRLSSTTTSATGSDRNDVIVRLRTSRDRTRTDSRRERTGRRHRRNSTGAFYISLFHQKHGSDRLEETNKQTTNASQFGYMV